MQAPDDQLQPAAIDPDEGLSFSEVIAALRARAALLVAAPIAAGALAFGATYLVAPTFTAVTTIMPPQSTQSGAAGALASLGALGGLAAGASGVKTPADQYVALLQSVTVADRIIDRFKLMNVYDARFRIDARKELASNLRLGIGKKDGLITIEVDDKSPDRAAEMANRMVDELRVLTGTLAVTEAQQRRVFFEQLMTRAQEGMKKAQQTLLASGFDPAALKAEPKATAEAYARLKAEVTSAEIRLQAMRANLSESTPEVRQQQATLDLLRRQLAQATHTDDAPRGTDYIGKFRDFKYQETLFELYARQFEIARTDESREGALIQVVDPATPPEKKSRPKRTIIGAITAAASIPLVLLYVLAGAAREKSGLGRRVAAQPSR